MLVLSNQPLYPAKLNLSHPALAGSSAQIICVGDQNGFLRNAGSLIAQPIPGGTLASGTTDAGSALAFNGSSTYLDFGTANIPTDEFTLLWGGVFDALSGVTGIVDCCNGSSNGWSLFTSGTDMYLSGNHYSGDLLTSGWATGTFYHGAARNKSGTGISIFRNGVKIADSGFGLVGVSNPTNPFLFGQLRVSGPRFISGRFAYFFLFDRYLSDDLIKSLQANPWQVFEPEDDSIDLIFAVPGDISGAGKIASIEAFGSTVLGTIIASSGIAAVTAIGQPSVGTQAQEIVGTGGITAAEASGSPTIGAVMAATGIGTAEAMGQPVPYPVVTATAIAGAEAFGSPAIAVAAVAAGIASAETLGSMELSATVAAAGITPTAAIGEPAVGGDPVQEITSAGIASMAALGQPSTGAAVQTSGIASAQAIGQPNVGAAAAEIAAIGITSAEILGSPSAAAGIDVAGIASAATTGSVALGARISAAGIVTVAAVGTPVVGEIIATTITGAGAIAAAEAFGQVSVRPLVPYTGTGFQPGSGHRRPVRNRVTRQIELKKMPHGIGAGGIPSGERLGYPALNWGGRSRKVRDDEFLLRRAA
jgi:hypothetical protein